MKSSYAMALVIALAAVGWLASPYLTGGTANEAEVPEATPAAVVTKAPRRVQVRESIAEIRINSLILTGQTEPSRHATVSAETAARVIAVEAEEGSVVKKGDIIVRLATDDREALLAEARALLKHRQIEYSAANKLSSKGYQTQTKLAETSANLESAEAHLRRILDGYARYYNKARTHLALGKDTPQPRPVERAGTITARPILGGLHHQYARI